MAGIRHAVVANEDDVYDVGKVASLQSRMEVLSEDINGLQRILLRSSEPVNRVGKLLSYIYELGIRSCGVTSLV